MSTNAFHALASDGSVRHVSEVTRGAGCACVCLGCGQPVLARQGEVVAWHFAHVGTAPEGSCAESALHRAGKHLLQQMDSVMLPGLRKELGSDMDELREWHVCVAEVPARLFRHEGRAELEVARGSRRLDALLKDAAGNELAVEIRVSHRVDGFKQRELAAMSLPTLEIDLSKHVGVPLTNQELIQLLSHRAPRKLVAGAELFLDPAISHAKAEHSALLANRNQRIAAMFTLSAADEQRVATMLDGVPLRDNERLLLIDWTGWRPDADLTRPFGGTHHRVWQAACLRALHECDGARVTPEELEDRMRRLLGQEIRCVQDNISRAALREYVGRLVWARIVREDFSLDRLDYLPTDFRLRLKVMEFAQASPCQKEALVQRWKAAHGKTIPTFNLRQEGMRGRVSQVTDACWQSHLWMHWIAGKTGARLEVIEVADWTQDRYARPSSNDRIAAAVESYLLLLKRAGRLRALQWRQHRDGRIHYERPLVYRVM